MSTHEDPVKSAQQVLGGTEQKPEDLLNLAEDLKQTNEFGYAWRVLAQARKSTGLSAALRTRLRQEQALCTYKDTHQNENSRLTRALEILGDEEDLGTSEDPETLGIAGAIHKRLWQVRNDKQELEKALVYYRRGHRKDLENQLKTRQGYPGINAALVLDLLAGMEEDRVNVSEENAELVATRRTEAKGIRNQIVTGLKDILGDGETPRTTVDWWVIVTLAEAYFGLEEYEDAGKWLKIATQLPGVESWQFESTARQLTELAKIRVSEDVDSPDKFINSTPGRVLKEFLGDHVDGLYTAYLGKVGLALSGGGFRASLYHIGVLAKLAELDVLRYVEVLSCVSGGSILGAYYYLEVRHLFQTKHDDEISRQDYIDLVKRVEEGFLKGVQTNVRTQVAAEFFTNLKMIFFPQYSRTERIGELFEENIYSEVKDGEEDGKRWLTELYIKPKGEATTFHPVRDNWRRKNKVPLLILNATTLNTGHNWQFTASWMGEPPSAVDPEIDSNYRLRRMYYREAPESYRHVRLGSAVGASACVPGLFEPIALRDLYQHTIESGPDEGQLSKIIVRLIDGGVHDNQGVVGLVEQDCDAMLVSDASGQMETIDNPSRGMIGVPLRSNSILMSRVREAEYDDLVARRNSQLLRDLMFVHLKMDLNAKPVDWIGNDEPHQTSDDTLPAERSGPFTRYGIRKSVQRLLAGIRTDLDSFNDVEAYALMLSGYRMTEFQFNREVHGFPKSEPLYDLPWRFLEIDGILQDAKGKAPILKILQTGSELAFKIWQLWPPLKIARWFLGLAALAVLVYGFFQWRENTILTVNEIGVFAVGAVLTAILGKWVIGIIQFQETITKILFGIGMAGLGFLFARLHLHVFDKIFLWFGRLDRLKK